MSDVLSDLCNAINDLGDSLKGKKFGPSIEFKVQSLSYLRDNDFISLKDVEALRKLPVGMGYLCPWTSRERPQETGKVIYVKSVKYKLKKNLEPHVSIAKFVSCGDGRFVKQVFISYKKPKVIN